MQTVLRVCTTYIDLFAFPFDLFGHLMYELTHLSISIVMHLRIVSQCTARSAHGIRRTFFIFSYFHFNCNFKKFNNFFLFCVCSFRFEINIIFDCDKCMDTGYCSLDVVASTTSEQNEFVALFSRIHFAVNMCSASPAPFMRDIYFKTNRTDARAHRFYKFRHRPYTDMYNNTDRI